MNNKFTQILTFLFNIIVVAPTLGASVTIMYFKTTLTHRDFQELSFPIGLVYVPIGICGSVILYLCIRGFLGAAGKFGRDKTKQRDQANGLQRAGYIFDSGLAIIGLLWYLVPFVYDTASAVQTMHQRDKHSVLQDRSLSALGEKIQMR